uniref:Alpha-galactosidase n=1 Tax=Heterorhabditis bacteriophora TaxID=37862 RepID=A0A1I7WAW8_HETBA
MIYACRNELGQLAVALSPCNLAGKDIHGEYIKDPKQLIGKSVTFKVKIVAAVGLPQRIHKARF